MKEWREKMERLATQYTGRDYEGEREEEDRIVNGYPAGSRPWYAALGVDSNEEKDVVGKIKVEVFCGGTLINHRFIL